MDKTTLISRSIAFNLLTKREERGENRKEFASFLEIPYRSYVNYEDGLQRPSIETLISISEKLGMTLSNLIGR